MRIAMIGHGRIPIPPPASGAVEAIISDYQFHCERMGHEFLAVNNLSPAESMLEAEHFKPDVVHLHDEAKIDAFAVLDAPLKIVTSHDPDFFEKPNPFKVRFAKGAREGGLFIGTLCLGHWMNWEYCRFSGGELLGSKQLIACPNGARSDLIRFTQTPAHPDRMICLGMIGQRKRQKHLLSIPFVDCIGPVSTYDPIVTTGVTVSAWDKRKVCECLTDYAALVLISKSEAAPLVVVEALMAGLDVVVSEAASANLDRRQPFVHVLDERTITNPLLLEMALKKVLARNKDRASVRKHAEENFDWGVLTKRYLETVSRLLVHA